ncbi:uncharacterized protein PITG_17446 [Phytophthora infestans T30-4]|uniref:Uncharacterized protein n=1 Tax=Phytophthora infestans (strain T30-4) TaxID=403677 RepID=D0NW29_PHYIT|nr:uncharacterized protein PITG_17446 [Phytophthora infestans T30-4]EEY66871.1 conserved hypothetical protein [Phytophthora infestans T30-4]|eukprot:XP_002896680.1 conserved hypothetical protein [Phytophthora infestans T30-4]
MAESFTVQDHFVELGYTIDDFTKGPISTQCRGKSRAKKHYKVCKGKKTSKVKGPSKSKNPRFQDHTFSSKATCVTN